MSKRTVELSIQLQNAKSIGELEKVLKEINTELKAVDANSDAFTQLSAQAKQADSSLKNIKEELKGVSDEKQLDSVAKLGGSLAAGLSVATIAASKFGDESKESITKAIQTATELSVVVGAIKPILEGLSSTNRKAFSEFVSGFKQSSIGATLFGNTTKAALTATGLGIFIVLIGTLIANWDAVSKAVKDFANSIPILKPVVEFIENLVEKVGSLSNLFNGIKAFIVGAFTSGKNAVDEFNKALEKGNRIAALEKELDAIKLQTGERERQIRVLESQKNKEQEIIGLKQKSVQDELKGLEDLQKAGAELTKEQKERLLDLQTESKILVENAKAAKFAAFEKANDVARKALEQRDQETQAFQESIDRQLEKDKLFQAQLLANYQGRKEAELKEDLNIELEKEESVSVLSAKREAAILDVVNKVKIEKNKKYLDEVRDEQISYLSSIKDRTEEQEQVLSDLKIEKFKETVDKMLPFVQVGLDAIGKVSQGLIDGFNRQVQSLQLEINAVTQQIQDSVNERQSLEAQLGDAQGVRRDQILAAIDQERAKEKKLGDERKKIQNEQIKAQNKANQIAWINSLINSIVQTTLASIEALPNVPLSIVVGALGAVGTGIIAANPPKDIPTFYQGGYTTGLGYIDSTGHQVAGVVHANEYVVPQKVLASEQGSALVNSLEAMRLGLPKFDVGGFSSSTNSTSFDLSSLKTLIESSRIYVSVQEINDVQTNVNVIQERGSL